MADGPTRLSEVMAARGLSQGQVERLLGLGYGVVSKYVRGLRTPDLERALLIEREFGIPVSAWVTLPDPKPATGTEG